MKHVNLYGNLFTDFTADVNFSSCNFDRYM